MTEKIKIPEDKPARLNIFWMRLGWRTNNIFFQGFMAAPSTWLYLRARERSRF